MSFGVGVGDCIAVFQLAENLYTRIYKTARDAPNELNVLSTQLGALTSSLKLLEAEIQDPESTLCRAGQERSNNLATILIETTKALNQLEAITLKYNDIRDSGVPKWKRKLAAIRFTGDAKAIDKIRAKITQQYGMIQLLLTSAGNSSLERIENESRILETKVSEIKELIIQLSFNSNAQNQYQVYKEPIAPLLSSIDGESTRDNITEKLLKHAEANISWLTIGIDTWILAGSWWQKKAHHYLEPHFSSNNGQVNPQAYADLLKASWILIDVIHDHPQRIYLGSSAAQEAIRSLADGVKADLAKIQKSTLSLPEEKQILEMDLDVWRIPPSDARDSGKLSSDLTDVPEKYLNHQVIFQCFITYFTNVVTTEGLKCFLLVLFDPSSSHIIYLGRTATGRMLFAFHVGLDLDEAAFHRLCFDHTQIGQHEQPGERGVIIAENDREKIVLQHLHRSALQLRKARDWFQIRIFEQQLVIDATNVVNVTAIYWFLMVVVLTQHFPPTLSCDKTTPWGLLTGLTKTGLSCGLEVVEALIEDYKVRPQYTPERDFNDRDEDLAGTWLHGAVQKALHYIRRVSQLSNPDVQLLEHMSLRILEHF